MSDNIKKMARKICMSTIKNSAESEKKESKLKGFFSNIEKDTVENNSFRNILYTGKNLQLVLMSLKPGESIGEEVHDDEDQFFRIESGSGEIIVNDSKYQVKSDFSVIIPAGAKHDVINTGEKDLKLYTIYAPPHHKDGANHKTREEAEEKEEHFDGKTSEV